MDKFLYRFRHAERLLGKEGKEGKPDEPGELEKLEIYFAPPEQLNDPLEGYREIYWAGDEIVWTNLFRHYLLILAFRSWQASEFLDGVGLPPDLPVHMSPDSLQGEFLEAYEEMESRILSDEIILRYISALAADERKCFRPELFNHLLGLHPHLLGLHPHFLDVVFDVNQTRMLTNIVFPPRPDVAARRKFYYEQVLSRFGVAQTEDERFDSYKVIALASSNLGISAASFVPAEDLGMHHLLTGYTELYFSELEILMYPRWYVACFMKECHNSAIWGTYGDNHRAICLKYKVSQEEYGLALEVNKPVGTNGRTIAFSYQNIPLQEVFYDREHSEIDFFKSLGNVPHGTLGKFWYSDGSGKLSSTSEWFQTDDDLTRQKYWESFDFSLTSKLPQWESEKEYRLVLKSGMNLSDKKNRQLQYKFDSLDGIIFGVKTSLKDKLKAIRQVKQHCAKYNRKDFNFYQAYYDPQSKSIQYGLLEPTAIMGV